MTYLTPILVILLLVFLNGLFVAADFSPVPARRPRLETLADQGRPSAPTEPFLCLGFARYERHEGEREIPAPWLPVMGLAV